MVVCLFLAVPWVCLRFVVVIFPDHTHLLFSFNRDPMAHPNFIVSTFKEESILNIRYDVTQTRTSSGSRIYIHKINY